MGHCRAARGVTASRDALGRARHDLRHLGLDLPGDPGDGRDGAAAARRGRALRGRGGVFLASCACVAARSACGSRARRCCGAALAGTLLCFGGNGLVTVAEQEVPSGLAALIVGSVPLWVVIMRLAEGDRPAAARSRAWSVGFAGLAVLVLPGDRPDGRAAVGRAADRARRDPVGGRLLLLQAHDLPEDAPRVDRLPDAPGGRGDDRGRPAGRRGRDVAPRRVLDRTRCWPWPT